MKKFVMRCLACGVVGEYDRQFNFQNPFSCSACQSQELWLVRVESIALPTSH